MHCLGQTSTATDLMLDSFTFLPRYKVISAHAGFLDQDNLNKFEYRILQESLHDSNSKSEYSLPHKYLWLFSPYLYHRQDDSQNAPLDVLSHLSLEVLLRENLPYLLISTLGQKIRHSVISVL